MISTFLHARLANASVLFAGIAGLWGLVIYARRRGVDSSYWGILAVGELLFLAQGLVGALLWLRGLRPSLGIHLLYGIVALLALPGYYLLSQGREDRRAALVYGLLCLFLAVMLWTRGIATG